MEDILLGTTDRTVLVFIPDPSSTTGAGKTGLAAADITVTYTRVETDNDVVHTDVTSSLNNLSALTDAHNDWGWKEVSSSLSKGLYRLDIADAVFASGAWYAVVQITITSGTAAATPKAFRLVARNDLDGVRLGLTSLPNAAADAAGGLPISDSGGLDLDSKIGALTFTVAGKVDSNVTHAAGTAWGSGAITAGSIATGAFTNAKFAVGAFEGAWEFDLDSVMFAGGTAGDYVKRVIADTNELQVDWTNGGRLDSLIDAIKAKTDNLPPDPADASDIAASFSTVNSTLATIASYIDTEIGTLVSNVAALPTAAQNATAVLTTQMTEAYAADGVAPTLAQSQFLLIAALTEFAISGTTITCKKLDGSTTAATYTLDSASAPTSRTRAS